MNLPGQAVGCLLLLLHHVSASGNGNIRKAVTGSQQRILQGAGGFKQLECNRVMDSCVPFEDKFGPGPFNSRVVIDCGSCVTMTGPKTYNFEGGLDIQGKLIIPETTSNSETLIIESTLILVQGELDIFATKEINGIPSVKFLLKGSDDEFFTGAGINSEMCSGSCKAGKRSVTIAGGKVNINGIPQATPTFLKLFDVEGDYSAIVVPDNVLGKWGVGSEIVITSNTHNWWADQERTITAIERVENGYTRIALDAPIAKPSTLKDNIGFAVEVALLSRNIFLDSEGEGGHFWVFETPKVEQKIEGLEIRNFGQQGTLGRYPLHFHMCEDVSGSVVSKNTVRASNQRCFVVHGTDNLVVKDNVAFDTKGHCYMTEDGIETGNAFLGNIGIRTSSPAVIIPDMGSNGIETDGEASTFWITNPTNTWIGNVVAGSEHFGTWFELKKRGPKKDLPEYAQISPKQDDLIEFKGNEFHSVGRAALKYYLDGYEPTTLTEFSDLSFHRNSLKAVDVHRTRNIHITGSFFQDNSFAIDIDRAEQFHLSDSKIIGHSDGYRDVVNAGGYGNPRLPCSGFADRLDGILFQPTNPQFGQYESPLNGLVFRNVYISGFEPSNCGKVLSLGLDSFPLRSYKTFEMYSTFENVSIAPSSSSVDFCNAIQTGSKDTYVTDLTGTLTGVPGRPQTLARNTEDMLHFITNSSSCTEDVAHCLVSCVDTCFRSVHVYLDKQYYPDHEMIVCDRNNRSLCMKIEGKLLGSNRNERYTLHLPSGRQYDVHFADRNGADIYPQDIDIRFRDKLCPTAPEVDDVRFLARPTEETAPPTPSPTSEEEMCQSLTQFEDNLASSWSARNNGSIEQAGSNGIKYISSGVADIVTGPELDTWSSMQNRGCFLPGTIWEFRAQLKLLHGGTGNGASCEPLSPIGYVKCPVVRLTLRDEEGDLIELTISGYQLTPRWNPDGFNSFSGFFTVPSEQEGWVGIPRKMRVGFTEFPKGLDLIVDSFNVVRADQMRPTAAPTPVPTLAPTTLEPTLAPTGRLAADVCSSLTDGIGVMSSSSWTARRFGSITQAGENAVKYLSDGQGSVVSGPELLPWSDPDNLLCFVAGSRWEFRANLHLSFLGTSFGAECDPNSNTNYETCPLLLLTLRDLDNSLFEFIVRNDSPMLWDANGLNAFVATFTVPDDGSWVGRARKMRVGFVRFPKGLDLLIGDFSVTQIY